MDWAVFVLVTGSVAVVMFLTGTFVGYTGAREDSKRQPVEGWEETSELIQKLTGCTVTGSTALDPFKVRAYVAKLEHEHSRWVRAQMGELSQ